MLDVTLLNVAMPDIAIPTKSKKTLIISGCRVILAHEKIYSELEEINYYPLNCNDYNFGMMEIELYFDNNFNNPYFEFYVQCISIRTDTRFVCKINSNRSFNSLPLKQYSKVTKDGKVSCGLAYFSEQKTKWRLCGIVSHFALKAAFPWAEKRMYINLCVE